MTTTTPLMLRPDSGLVLRSVSECLRRLIRAEVTELQAESAVVFESPADIDSQGESKLSLFMYHTAINHQLRNLPDTLTRRAGSGPSALVVEPAPLVVDLVYVLVPFAKTAELELVLHAKIAALFHAVRGLSGPYLDAVLRETDNLSVAIVPEPTTIDTLQHLWSTFHGKSYKPTLIYRLSPVRIPAGMPKSTDITRHDISTAREIAHG